VHHLLALQIVPPKSGSPGIVQPQQGPAPSGQQAASPGGGITALLPIIMIVPFLFLMFRRQKKEAEQRSKLKKGDRVVSSSGLIGDLLEMDERIAKVKIAPGTTVQMLVSSISPLEEVAVAKEADLKDLKDAKAGAADKK
jgi:preprotein translocase subunit YajC